jgi:hypothetical protein
MKNALMVAMLLVLMPILSECQVPEWRSTVVLKADYGNGEGEFCSKDVVENAPESDQAVSCYYVGAEGIFIVDRYQGNIKVFDLSGSYVRTISLKVRTLPVPREWGLPGNKQAVAIEGEDIVVTGGVIYLLHMLIGIPHDDVTKYFLYALDSITGELLGQIMIHNAVLGKDLEGNEVSNGVRIYEESGGTLVVYDRIRRMSYPLIANGSVVAAQEQSVGIPGQKFGMGAVRYDPEKGSVAVLGTGGAGRLCECRGSPVAIEASGGLLLVDDPHVEGHEDRMIHRAVYDHNCQEIGRIDIPIQSRKGWGAFAPNDLFRFAPDGRLYEIHLAVDALYVYKWSL